MIIKHEFSNNITTPKREQFFSFFMQLKSGIEILKETLNIEDEAESGDLDPFDELDALGMQKINDLQGLVNFARGSYSAKPAMYVCARDTLAHLKNYNKLLSDYVGFGMFLDEESRAVLRNTSTKIISEMAYMLWFEFDLDVHEEKIANGEDYIDEIVKMYCDTYSVSVEQIVKFAKDTRQAFPFHLSIFDDYPELEEDFEAIMGPDLGALIGVDLTIEQVRKIISGAMTPEELLAQVASYGEDLKELDQF